jgi:lysophospholipase L1-like esterase
MAALGQWCLALLLVLPILWVITEAAARFFLARRNYYVWPPNHRIDSELRRDVFPDLSSRTSFIVNRDGERGSQPPPSGIGVYRVLVTGGSAAECYFLDQQECWPVRLQRDLETPAACTALGVTRVHVGAVAKSGLDSTKLYLLLQRILPQYRKMDAVVIMVGMSDILSWMRCSAPETPVFAPPNLEEVFAAYPEKRYDWHPLSATALAECFRLLSRCLCRRGDVRSDAGASVARLRTMRQQATNVKTDVPPHASVLNNYATMLEKSIRLCQKFGSRVLVVGQPWLDTRMLTKEEKLRLWSGSEGDAYRHNVSTYYSSEVLAQLAIELNGLASRVAKDNGAAMIDVQSCLQPPAACFYDDFHFTPIGAAILANTLTNALLSDVLSS